jgi:hypothetical protein
MLKHIGKMKHNGAKVCVVYRTLPGDAYAALVIGTSSLSDIYHNTLMSELESPLGQQANELGDHLSNRYFQDGTNMLEQLHRTGKLIKVSTTDVSMTPVAGAEVSLDELNVIIAEQKGVTLDDLSIKDEMPHVKHKTKSVDVEIKDLTKTAEKSEVVITDPSTIVTEGKDAKFFRSEADRLYKEAAKLKKLADDMDPPKKKVTSAPKNKETN